MIALRVLIALLLAVASSPPAVADEAPDPRIETVRGAIRATLAYGELRGSAQSDAGMRLEDEWIPRVREVVEGSSRRLPPGVRAEVIEFLLASRGSANEDVSGIGVRLYENDPRGFCDDVAARGEADREELMMRAQSGRALEGRPALVSCPPPGIGP